MRQSVSDLPFQPDAGSLGESLKLQAAVKFDRLPNVAFRGRNNNSRQSATGPIPVIGELLNEGQLLMNGFGPGNGRFVGGS